MKKIISVILVMALALPIASMAYSVEESSFQDKVSTIKIKKDISNIPIFVTYIEGSNKMELTSLQEKSNMKISEAIEDCADAKQFSVQVDNEHFGGVSDKYQIAQLANDEIDTLIQSPSHAAMFNRVRTLLEQGVAINYINIYTVQSPDQAQVKALGPDDPAYWENSYSNLGTVDGYKFLYGEYSLNVESSWANPNNLKGAMNWTAIAKFIVKTTISKSKFDGLKTANTSNSYMSTLFNAYTPPYSVTYGQSSGYVNVKVSGDLYGRNFYIRDLKDRAKGYAYCDAGYTERFAAVSKFDIKYPYSKNPSGTYNYNYITKSGTSISVATDGFYGPVSTLRYLKDLYERGAAVWLQTEKVDVDGTIYDLITS